MHNFQNRTSPGQPTAGLMNSGRRLLTAISAMLAVGMAACGGSGSTQASSALPPAPPPAPAPNLPSCPSAAVAPIGISSVQGRDSQSALKGQTVAVRGVVVGDFQLSTQLNGFFVQQVVPDGDVQTSEGLFVYAPGAKDVAPGDYVQVVGVVAEFTNSNATANDSITQISNITQLDVCGQVAVPEPVEISLPVSDAMTLERYEGMRVRLAQRLIVTDTGDLGRFGQLGLAARRHANPTNLAGGGSSVANRLERIVLDDGSAATNPNPMPYLSASDSSGTRRSGDALIGLVGVLSHNFGAYRIHPTQAPNLTPDNPRPTSPPAVGVGIKVASFNVLNYFTTVGSRGASNAAEFIRQRDKLIDAMTKVDADVIALMEIENNQDTAVADLLAALNARLGAGTYAAIGAGRIGTDEIKVDMLFKPARIKKVGNAVLPTGAILADYTAQSGRPPLAQRFETVPASAGGAVGGFWLVANHFKSKGSCPSSGDVDLGQGCWNQARTVQARALADFAATLVASGEPDVLMVGDFNAYLEEDPAKTLEARGFESLLKRLPESGRYTYVFDGEIGALDHAWASSTLRTQVAGVGVWHINADEPSVLDYNTEGKSNDRYAPTAFRSSDHDPVLVGLNLSADPPARVAGLALEVPANGVAQTPLTITAINPQPGAGAMFASLSLDWGDGSAAVALSSGQASVSHTYAAAGSYSITARFSDSAGSSVSVVRGVVIAPAAVSTSDLFMSEYVEGSGNNKAIELYNPTAAALDLSAYTLRMYANGSTTATNSLTLSGTLSPGATWVVAHGSAVSTLLARANQTIAGGGIANFNGDDAMTLEKNGVVIDRFGQLGVDPGAFWSGAAVQTQDRTLRRKPQIKGGDNQATAPFDPSLQWDSTGVDTFDGLGSHTVSP
jgi:predicted extracellular nuclease